MNGILLVDKPKGWTSFDVVARVRGIIRTEIRKSRPEVKNVKVGHTGTLDPSATGLLVLCIGSYTKKVPEMIVHDKTYEVEVTLGATSDTGDQEGEITVIDKAKVASEELVATVLNSFVGKQMQTPPAYSAIKIDGKRAYDLARAGKEVVIAPRAVTIHSIEDVVYDWPKVTFTTRVSSGTYIRSLASDIGQKLGRGGYMSQLRRTSVGRYSIDDAIGTDELSIEGITEHLL